MNYVSHLRLLIIAGLLLSSAGCSLFRDRDRGTTEVKTAYGTLPVRREVSTSVDLAQPTVVLADENVVVSGTVRLRSASYNPDARVLITIVDRYGKQADQIFAKLQETDQDRVMSYRVRFAPVPGRGSSLLVAYQDYQPFANYDSAYIGSGGGAAPSGRSSGPRVQRGEGTTNSRGPTYGGSTPRGGRMGRGR